MIGYLKAIYSEFKKLENLSGNQNEIRGSDIRASNLPTLIQKTLPYLLEASNEYRSFYRGANGRQYDSIVDVPKSEREAADRIFVKHHAQLKVMGLTQVDDEYRALCLKVLNEGKRRTDRTGTGTIGIFGHQMRFNLENGFPLLTTKRVHMRSVVGEIIWFLQGSTNNNDLKKLGVSIWDEWADENGELGPVYGKQWRRWESSSRANMPDTEFMSELCRVNKIDQITDVIDQIKRNPDSRRLIVTAWNPGDVKDNTGPGSKYLPACHTMFQFYVQDGKLSCQLYQRSGDILLGIPFNIASYALLTHMVAQICDLKVGEFIHTIGDAHIYLNHTQQILEQIGREPMAMPKLILDPSIKNIDDFKMSHVRLDNYNPHPAIKGKVSV